jgi:tetratricopeptide (TPR) repeat protein/tRNA A-37 threonylcarbamoyl transferase component Bud32
MSEQLDRLRRALSDRYAIERELGTGGMATVYLAQDLKHDRKVAVKVLHPELAASLGPTRFLNEIKVTAGLSHPHILPLHDSGEAQGFLYYVMPYVEGETLRDRLRREGALPVDQTVRIVRDVADALAKAHAAGIVHRDIKPDNVLLSGKHAVVADFGVAKAVSASQDTNRVGMTQLGTALGTPMYMAPEQAAGDPDTDHRADIYALGIMAYEMLTGGLPFDAKTPQAMLAAHVSVTPPPVSQRRPDVPNAVEAIVMKCLAKEPSDRWADAGMLSEALERVVGGAATPVRTSAVDIEGFVRQGSPWRVGLTFALLAGIGVAIVYLLMLQLGLPDWTLWSATGLAGAAVVLTSLAAWAERRPRSGWTWRRARGVLITGGALFLLAVGGNAVMRTLGIGPAGTLVAAGLLEMDDRLILAEFENHTADSTVGETVTELLRIDLAQSPTVSLVEGRQISEALRRMQRDPVTPVDEALAREVAEREGIKGIVVGEIRTLGTDYVVAARLISANGETLAAARETASEGQIIGAVDRLSASLRERIGESLRTIRADEPLERVTTASTEALRLYAQGDRANDHGDPRRAIGLLEDAIREDSLFAMAHRKLAIVLTNQRRDPDRAREAFTHAYDLRDRLTERERYLAEAAYYEYVSEDTEASIDAYETLLEKYPSDPIALNNVGTDYRSVGRLSDAEASYRRAITQGVAPATTYTNAIDIQYLMGMKDSALVTMRRFAERYPEHPQLPFLEAALASSEFRHAEAEQMMREVRGEMGANPASRVGATFELASVIAIQGRLEEALEMFSEGYRIHEQNGLEFVNEPLPVLQAILASYPDLLYHGATERAAARLDDALAAVDYANLSIDRREDLTLAGIYARAERLQTAGELIDRSTAEQPDAIDGSSYLWAQGMVALGEGRTGDAIGRFRAAIDSVPQCPLCFRVELGEAYARAGQPDSVIAVYEHYLNRPVLYRAQQDAFVLASVLVGLGEAYEATGNETRAVETYDRFLNLWSGADEEFRPLMDDVRRRIARLVGEP